MSTSPAPENTMPATEVPPQVPLTEQVTPTETTPTVDLNAQIEPKITSDEIVPQVTTLSEEKGAIESTSVPSGELNEAKEQNVQVEQKVTISETESKPILSEAPRADEKVPEGHKDETPVTITEKIDSNEEKTLKTAEIQNSGEQSANEPTASEYESEKNSEKDKDIAENIEKGDKGSINNEEVNKEDKEKGKQQENASEEHDNPDGVNVQELTEHVMNILNDGLADEVLTEHTLMKKNVDLQQFIVKLIRLLKEKTDLCANLDRQNSALISQAESLKAVISITKDLLGIRNMEIERLHGDLTAMEETIKEERIRHNNSIQHLNEAMSLNDKLKTEYLTQMDLFQKLRDKYNEKVVYLTRENQRLNSLANPNGTTNEASPEETNASDLESSQTESVDK